MSLEDFWNDIDSSESGLNSNESTKEVSEKFKESVKKATAWIWRTRKDEQKAKKYDFLLANFLVKIIVDKKYDILVQSLFKAMDYWYTSNFILWIISLINEEISNKIRELSNKENIIFTKKEYNIDFDDNNLPEEIKNRINYWIEDIIDSITIEFSSIQNKKLIETIEKDDTIIIEYTILVFMYFLNDLKIKTSKNKLKNISEFIISEVTKSLKKIKIEEI